jgi:hypothetical protein
VKYLLLIFFAVLMGLGIGGAEEKKPTDTAGGEGGTPPPAPYQVKVLSSGMVEIGEPVLIGVYDAFTDELRKNGLDTDPETVRKNLKLYLNGVAMEGLLPVVLPPEAAVGLKATDPKPALVLQFVLARDSNNELNRKAWDSLLSQLQFGPQRLQAGVGLNGKVPHLTPAQDLPFQVRDQGLITSVIVIGSVLLAVGMLAVILSGMVRETGPGTPYSLGKTQMAFWGLLVAISFLAVWLIGHRMERIPPQVLILIGISGATGLGSVLITSNPNNRHSPPNRWKEYNRHKMHNRRRAHNRYKLHNRHKPLNPQNPTRSNGSSKLWQDGSLTLFQMEQASASNDFKSLFGL